MNASQRAATIQHDEVVMGRALGGNVLRQDFFKTLLSRRTREYS